MFKKGHPVSKKLREKLRRLHLGKKLSEEVKAKIKKHAVKPWLGKKIPKDVIERRQRTRRKNAIKRGYWRSEEQRRSNSLTVKGRKRPPFSEEWKRKIGQQSKKRTKGKDNPNWKGGITLLQSKIRNSDEYKDWRSKVFKRDNYSCQQCGKKSEGDIEVHHQISFSELLLCNNIKSFQEALNCREIWNISNGITFCESCHKKTDNYGWRSYNKLK